MTTTRTERSLSRIRTQNERIKTLVRSGEARLSAAQPRISKWSVSEHLDHILKVAASIVRRVNQSDAEPGQSGINFLGRAVLVSGWIPRGRGKTPERLAGTRVPGTELDASMAKLEAMMSEVAIPACEASRQPTVPHPLFGGLTPSQALRFAIVHTNHHLRIVDEILAE